MSDLSSHEAVAGDLLQINRIRDERGAILELRGELDLSSAPQLERHLSEIDRAGPERILIDLSNLEFIDSTGLALMINAQEAAEANGHELCLRLGSDQVQRLFRLTGLLDRFTIQD